MVRTVGVSIEGFNQSWGLCSFGLQRIPRIFSIFEVPKGGHKMVQKTIHSFFFRKGFSRRVVERSLVAIYCFWNQGGRGLVERGGGRRLVQEKPARCTSYVLDVWALDLCTGGLGIM